jgi:hypothetical protein
LEFPEVHDWHIEATASALNGAVASTDYRDAVAAFDKAFDGHMGWNCNSSKSNTVDGIDPDSGVVVSLFNPRRQAWYDHFKWDRSFTQILGTTASGRATIARLDMNSHSQQVARALWIASGYWP